MIKSEVNFNIKNKNLRASFFNYKNFTLKRLILGIFSFVVLMMLKQHFIYFITFMGVGYYGEILMDTPDPDSDDNKESGSNNNNNYYNNTESDSNNQESAGSNNNNSQVDPRDNTFDYSIPGRDIDEGIDEETALNPKSVMHPIEDRRLDDLNKYSLKELKDLRNIVNKIHSDAGDASDEDGEVL